VGEVGGPGGSGPAAGAVGRRLAAAGSGPEAGTGGTADIESKESSSVFILGCGRNQRKRRGGQVFRDP
jgi:hypothetical protein